MHSNGNKPSSFSDSITLNSVFTPCPGMNLVSEIRFSLPDIICSRCVQKVTEKGKI